MAESVTIPADFSRGILNAAAPAQAQSKFTSQGVFSNFPMATAKFARHRDREADYTDTMARMYIPVNAAEYDKFISSMEDTETQKVLQALAGTGTAKGGKGYLDFLLQSVQHNLAENSQVSETLSDNYVAYFFGQSPPVFQYSGVVLNTYQDDWTMRMLRIYRDIGRGSQLARHQKVMTLTYDSMMITGAMMNFNWAHTAELQTACSFSFSFLVKEIKILYGGLVDPSRPKSLGYTGPSPAIPPEPTTTTAVIGDTGGGTAAGAVTDQATLPADAFEDFEAPNLDYLAATTPTEQIAAEKAAENLAAFTKANTAVHTGTPPASTTLPFSELSDAKQYEQTRLY